MERGSMETLFVAITVGDEQQVELCLKGATIATVLEFESVYGEPPLHLCVKLGGVSHLGLVRRLLASGLVDFDQRDNEGQTVLEYAYQNGDQELTKQLIAVEMEGLDDATACYKMMKHDSLDLFKLFLSMKNMSEDATFKNIASAFAKLNVKNFVLSKELRLFAQWKLSDYAYRNLSGNWPGVKDPAEWKIHVDNIDDCWRVISAKYDTRLYDDVDDQLLHRLQVIHNCLYFLKHKQFLNHLPMHEIVFCVATFISVLKSTVSDEYRLLVNKRLVMDFVRMIHRQLKLAKNHLEMVEKQFTTIMQEAQRLDAHAKDRLIEEMLEKLKATNFPNKDHWIAETTKKIDSAVGPNKDVLIKDMMKKIKSSDKMYFTNEIQAIDETNKRRFIDAISKGELHVAHPQNVVNRLMAGWKKGKSIDSTVAEIVGEECFDLKHLLRGKDRCIIRQAKKWYGKTRQLYSLQKVCSYCEEVVVVESENYVVPEGLLKRMLQVLGETLKNTQNSPNIPGKVEQTLQLFLSDPFLKAVKTLREAFSHGMSLKKVLARDTISKLYNASSREDFMLVNVIFVLLIVVALEDAKQTLYGLLHRCGSYEELRSLLLYVGDISEIEQQQKKNYKLVQEYFECLNNNFNQLSGSAVTQTIEYADHIRQFELKRVIVEEMDEYLDENKNLSFVEIRRACFVGDDLSAVRRLLHLKLTKGRENKFWRVVQESWIPIQTITSGLEFEDKRLLGLNPFRLAGCFTVIASSMDIAERLDYILHTRKLIKRLGLTDSLDENAVQELNHQLKAYYDNIFLVESKWKKVKSFCISKQIDVNETLINELKRKDQTKLQKLFDGRRKKLSFILKKHRLNTLESLVSRLYYLPQSSVFALEYLQLELCEMLVSVGYFGDSFQYMKYRLPMIQGKNYRNFLAHDSVSYNILTDSSMEKIVINAFVFSYTELKFFANRVTKSEDISMALPTAKEIDEWANEQYQLLGAFRTKNVNTIFDAMKTGGEIRSQFCYSPSKRYSSPQYINLTELVDLCNPEPTVVELLNKYFPNFTDQSKDPARQLKSALMACNYQTAFDRTIGRGDTKIREELFDWPELFSSLRKTHFINSEAFVSNEDLILSKLIEHANEPGVREMLLYFDVLQDMDKQRHLGDALLYNVKSIAEMLFPRTPKPNLEVLLLAIMLHWNDMFSSMMANVEMDSRIYEFLLITVAQARNYTAAVCLLEHDTFKHFIPEIFTGVCQKACAMGETGMLQHLLNIYPASSQVLGEIIHHAAVHKQWKCVSVLLDRDAPVDIIYPGKRHEEINTLVILVKFGLWRLIDRVKSVNCRIYADIRTHPLAVAIKYGNASRSMVRTLQRLGFHWLDNSIILHQAIAKRDDTRLGTIWEEVDAIPSEPLDTEDSQIALAIKVLLRWQMIGFVEESTTEHIPITCAIENKDKDMIKELLDRAKSMRQLEGIGILNNIVFKTTTSIVCFGKRSEDRINNVQKICKDIITMLKSCTMLDMGWQEFRMDLGVPVQFCVLSANEEKIEPLPQTMPDVAMRKSGSLLDILNVLMTVSNTLFAEASVVAAHFKLSEVTSVCFWQVEDINCVYNILPVGAEIDLSATVNYRDLLGENPLHTCMEIPESLALIKMLFETGADPLLANSSGKSAIHRSLWNSKDYDVAHYLFDVCQDRELRNEHGVSLVDLEDGKMKHRLIHIAVMTGRRDIVKRLLRLKVDVSVKNSFGFTPIQIFLNSTLPNSEHMIKLLLDYDSSSIDAIDPKGNTLLHSAVKFHSIEVLQEILKHDPDITICTENTPLYAAIASKKVHMAKCLLRHAIEKGIRGITSIDEINLVSLSLICNDFSLSKALLEYELEHPLEEISVTDVPRIEALLNSPLLKDSDETVWEVAHLLPESESFVGYLKILCISLRDQ